MIQEHPKILWQPSRDMIQNSHIHHFMDWLDRSQGLKFDHYEQLWQWSVDHMEDFWQAVADYFSVKFYQKPRRVLNDLPMPDQHWFEGGTLNYAEHIFRHANEEHPAIIHATEQRELASISWAELEASVAKVAAFLSEKGVQRGDTVAAFISNIPEATIAFLAANSIGAVWSSCSPDFGVDSVMERFEQIEPKVIFGVDGYSYGGKLYDKRKTVAQIADGISSVNHLVWIRLNETEGGPDTHAAQTDWSELMERPEKEIDFQPVDFEHPIWVLYSSGTTGKPKAITHSHGGVLLEHLKYMAFHNDVHFGERFFWYSTTGWMMWNFTQAALLMGASIVLYDGSAGYPNLHEMWSLAERVKMNHFGTSAPFIIACMKKGLQPNQSYDLSGIRSIGSTGAPLPPEGFDWVYQHIHDKVWLCSMSGGTDVCTAFVGGCPVEPVYYGEIQRRALGCSLYAYNDEGVAVEQEVGEMVITKPMPSMPVFLWNDKGKKRYRASYFEEFPGIWRHGDWVYLTPRNTLVILGRSDATLNRQGVRIGTAEIYRAVEQIPSIKSSLIVNLELENGDHYMPLFVQLEEGEALDDELIRKISSELRTQYSPRHVPDEVIVVKDIPRTISGKKMETPVKKILRGIPAERAASKDAMQNPESLDFFVQFYQVRKLN